MITAPVILVSNVFLFPPLLVPCRPSISCEFYLPVTSIDSLHIHFSYHSSLLKTEWIEWIAPANRYVDYDHFITLTCTYTFIAIIFPCNHRSCNTYAWLSPSHSSRDCSSFRWDWGSHAPHLNSTTAFGVPDVAHWLIGKTKHRLGESRRNPMLSQPWPLVNW